MTTLDERYPDLLGHGDDPELARLVADLDSAYTASTPPPHLRASLQHALHERTAAHDPPFGKPTTRPRWLRPRRIAIVVGLAAAIALAGSAVADPTLVDQALSMWPGTGQVATQHLGQDVNLSQSACGFTMTVSRVYADANRIIVGYTLTGPAGRRFNNINAMPTLTDAQGHTLPMLEGAGTAMMGNQSGDYTAFDAAGSVAARAAALQLHMTAPSVSAVEVVTGAAPAAVACETYTPLKSADASTIRDVTVNGPLTFDLSVPVDPHVRVATLNQVAQSSHGTTVTLERIVVTPTETRLYLRGPAVADLNGGPAIAPILYVDGKEIDGGAGSAPNGNGEQAASFVAPLYDNHGDWTVKVLTDPVMNNSYRSYTDSVTFHVSVP